MKTQPKPPETLPETARAADPAITTAAETAAPLASPARALQARLARELERPSQPWLWHSAGLVLTLILALSGAGVLFDAGY